MSSTGSSKRITFKRTRPNPLFQEWLEELHEEAQAKKSKLEPMLKQALDSISKYPLPLQTGSECAILKGFEKKLCMFLDKRLEVYNFNKSLNDEAETEKVYSNEPVSTPQTKENDDRSPEPKIIVERISPKEITTVLKKTNSIANKPNKKTKTYKPSFRSGGYAILLALLEQFRNIPNEPLSKEQLIEKAQPHSEESFIRPKPDTFYTAWSSMSKLVTEGLVQKVRNNKKIKYMLSDAGTALAIELSEESANIPTANDIIFTDFNTDTVRVERQVEEIVKSQKNPVVTKSKDAERLSEWPANSNGNKETSTMNNGNDKVDDCVINISNERCIELNAGTFDIVLLIDKNETSGVTKTDPTVAQFNKYPALKHEYRSLKVGDFTWVAQDRQNKDIELVLPYVIERKRMDDLGHSIKDGRFHEQKFRLRKCGLKNVIYLVENFGKNKHVGLPVQSLMQALSNTRVHDRFKVHITNSLSNTVRFLAMMSKRLTIEYKDKNLKGRNREPQEDELMTFKYFNTSSMKSKPLTVTETFIKLILQLKGVSVEKALAITKVYSTPSLLIQKYKECEQKEGEFLLANLKYGELNRSVGPVVSKSMYQLFSSLF